MDEHAINLTSEQGALAEDQQHPDAAPAADDTERASESDFDAAPTTPYALRLSDDLAASDIPDNFQEQLAEFGSAAAKAGVREDVAQRMLDVYVAAITMLRATTSR